MNPAWIKDNGIHIESVKNKGSCFSFFLECKNIGSFTNSNGFFFSNSS